MSGRTRRLTFAALMAALAAVLLIAAAYLPAGRLALTACAGVCCAFAVVRCGLGYAFGCFAVSGLLGLLLSPVKGAPILYLAFPGWYPIVKSLLERPRSRLVEWVLKLLLFNLVFALLLFFGKAVLAEALPQLDRVTTALLWLGGNVVFAVYDLGLDQLLRLFLKRFVRN